VRKKDHPPVNFSPTHSHCNSCSHNSEPLNKGALTDPQTQHIVTFFFYLFNISYNFSQDFSKMGRGMTLSNLIILVTCMTLLMKVALHFVAYSSSSSCAGWGLIIDAGSSGSRVHIFTWNENKFIETLKEVSTLKISPGISSYETGKEAGESLETLLSHARDIVPARCWSHTRLHLKATAGMRLVGEKRSNEIFEEIRSSLAGSSFKFLPTDAGVVLGADEAEFDYLSVNFALGKLVARTKQTSTEFVGVTDLGGASTQISFEVEPEQKNNPGVRTIALPGSSSAAQRSIYAVSRLHMGLYEAFKNTRGDDVSFPCALPGDYDKCARSIRQFIHKHAMEDMSNLGTTAVAPPRVKSVTTFYGLDNYAKLASVVFIMTRESQSKELPPQEFLQPDMKKWSKVARTLCALDWRELREIVPLKSAKDRLLRTSCFGIIYVTMLVEDVYNLRGGGAEEERTKLIFAHSIGDVDGSWATGAAVKIFSQNGDV